MLGLISSQMGKTSLGTHLFIFLTLLNESLALNNTVVMVGGSYRDTWRRAY